MPAQIEHPFERTGTRFEARFASGDQLFEPRAGPRRKVDRSEQRFADDYFVSDRCIPVDRQPVVGPLLVFDRAADRDVRVSRFPVRRQVRFEPVDPFGNHEEMKVAAFPDHLPRFGPPRIGLLDEKVGTETGENRAAGRNFIGAGTCAPHRKTEIARFDDDGTVATVLFVDPVHVTMPAPGAQFVATVPGIPQGHNRRF